MRNKKCLCTASNSKLVTVDSQVEDSGFWGNSKKIYLNNYLPDYYTEEIKFIFN